MTVTELARIARNVAHLDHALAFYCDALGFRVSERLVLDDPAWAAALGIPGARANAVRLHLGEQCLELRAFDPPPRASAPPPESADAWFQHLAIIVGDIDAACAQLRRFKCTPISANGPETLPANTGGVTAFKFRDPDGHPLELLALPPGIGDPAWQRGNALFRGIDHSAINAPDLDAALAFFVDKLGLRVAARTLNQGAEQSRLDAVPDAVVDVVALQPDRAGPPHVELLHYRHASGRVFPPATRADDVMADRLILRSDPSRDPHGTSLRSPGGHFLSLEPPFARDAHATAT